MPESRADDESDQDQGRKFDFGKLRIDPVAVNDIPEVRDSGLLASHTLLRYAQISTYLASDLDVLACEHRPTTVKTGPGPTEAGGTSLSCR